MTTAINRPRPGRTFTRAASLCLLALAAILFQSGEARAQWTTGGNTTSTTNNVGIGTAAPEQTLQVNGPSEILSTGSGAGFKFRNRNSATNADDWVWYSSDNVARFWRAGIGDLFGVTPTGNFGIGTISPGRRLEVLAPDGEAARLYRNAPNAGWGVNMVFALNNSNNARTDYAGVHGLIGNAAAGAEGGSLVFTTATSGGLTEKMRVDSAGNFGIGTATPVARLDVMGAANIWGGARYAVNSGYMAPGSLTLGSTVANFGGGSGWSANTAGLMLEAADNTEIAVHDAGTRIASFMYFEGGAANRVTIGRDMGWGGIGTVSINGSVGVGTAAPAFKFDVQGGAVNASGGLCIAGECKSSWSQVGGSQWTTSGSSVLYNSGNVGIGTATPVTRLDVMGAANVWGGSRYAVAGGYMAAGSLTVGNIGANFGGGSGWSANTAGLMLEAADNTEIAVHDSGTRLASLLYFEGGAANRVTIGRDMGWGNVGAVSINSNVGVGTTTPTQKLDVRGNVTLEAGASPTLYTGTGSTELNRYLNLINSPALTSASGLKAGGVLVSDNYAYANPGKNDLIVKGNVGIGITNPTTRLHVAGDITVDGNITAKYQDLAEWVPSTQKLAAGTVVVLDTRNSNHVLASTTAYDTRVAGVISAQPGIMLGEAGEGKTLVATTGRVKVKVDATRAPVQIGDLIVTSDLPGVAMKSEPMSIGGRQLHAPGTIIGKALEPLEKGTGEILVLLSLQ